MSEAESILKLPLGFRFAAGYAGIRKARADDLALMVSECPAAAAAVFTRNAVRAAPVELSARAVRASGGIARVIVANAGNANCATRDMDRAAQRTAAAAAGLAGVPENQVLVASTGVIGEPLDEALIPLALPTLWEALDRRQFQACGQAILTTDTVPKLRSLEVKTGAGTARLAGMAKGAGMIMPDMATMLAFLFTDAAIEPDALQAMLGAAVQQSFNCITVDSDTSTNDTVFLLANGASGARPSGAGAEAFQSALNELTRELAIAIARDGEGSRRLAEIAVRGTRDDRDAKAVAMAIANSPLVKTALAGADPNWGRILGAAGKAAVPFDPRQADISINGIQVCSGGVRAAFDEPAVQRKMEADDVLIEFRLRGGRPGRARVWTCDFTADYIRINADYRT